ncbi:MAG: 4Fe-4S dicluster domain-containing protein [Deltaproteobacteria bacterium]|nr:4Fe-4S dicluster domain-containing protein [Deltaproteobacteria bacterium]
MPTRFLDRSLLAALVEALLRRGRTVYGPVSADGAIGFDEIHDVTELACALRDVQEPGRYRIEADPGGATFGVANGPSGLKRLFLAPSESVLAVARGVGTFHVEDRAAQPEPIAVLGARPCDLAALAIQDRVLLGGRYPEPRYGARRRDAFLVAVNCTRAASTCFCASLGDGPEVTAPHDVALTELATGFVAHASSARGRVLLDELGAREASAAEQAEERAALARCAYDQCRSLEPAGLADALYANLDHPRWDEVAERCVACGNCTMVCPTCFCQTTSDHLSLDGERAERTRSWDSCFTPDHGYVHGKNYRPHTREKYRQWLTHKLAGWVEQFGRSGCVGCGRCITWCPAAIDLTEEAAALRVAPRDA